MGIIFSFYPSKDELKQQKEQYEFDVEILTQRLDQKEREYNDLRETLGADIQMIKKVVPPIVVKLAENPTNESLKELAREIGKELVDDRQIKY